MATKCSCCVDRNSDSGVGGDGGVGVVVVIVVDAVVIVVVCCCLEAKRDKIGDGSS